MSCSSLKYTTFLLFPYIEQEEEDNVLLSPQRSHGTRTTNKQKVAQEALTGSEWLLTTVAYGVRAHVKELCLLVT